MRLTCCCVASIEVKSVIDDLNDTASGDTPALEKFRADHRPCLDKWRARCISWPCWESLPLVEFTPEALAAMQQMNTYPGKSDPYQRFRDAISRDGKRVFVELDGRMHVARQHFGEMYKDSPSNYFIEGSDIPMQPTQEWLDKLEVELTWQCRNPKHGEMWQGLPGGSDGCLCNTGNGRVGHIGIGFSGRRWIVRKKVDGESAQQSAIREAQLDLAGQVGRHALAAAGVDDGFEKWWERERSDKSSWWYGSSSRKELHAVWKAAQAVAGADMLIELARQHSSVNASMREAEAPLNEKMSEPLRDFNLATHAAEHDAIVRKLLMDAIHQTIPEHVATNYEGKIHRLGDQVLSPLQPSRRVGQDAPEQEVIECKGIRPVNLHIGQSATEIVKQARDLVQGMNITKKTKYCAFNIAGSELIWGIK